MLGQHRHRTRPLLQLGEVRRRLGHRAQAFSGRPGCVGQRRQGLGQRLGSLFPTSFDDAAHLAAFGQRSGTGQPQVTRCAFQFGLQLSPGLQAAGVLQARSQHVPAQLQRLPRGQRGAQELHAGFHQLVRFIEHRHVNGGQQLRHPAVAQGHIGKKKMVVDHHQIGRHGLAPGLHHVASAVFGALGAQTVVAGGRDQGDDRRTVVQAIDFGQITGAGALSPLHHTVQGTH